MDTNLHFIIDCSKREMSVRLSCSIFVANFLNKVLNNSDFGSHSLEFDPATGIVKGSVAATTEEAINELYCFLHDYSDADIDVRGR